MTTVDIEEFMNKRRTTVSSIDLIIPENPRERFWELGKQHVHKNNTSKGSGEFGLYLPKSICAGANFIIRYER